jgi:hypothetical protein
MSKLLTIAYIAALTVSLASSSLLANNNSSSYSFNKLAESLCESAKEDRVLNLRRQLRNARSHIREIYLDIDCDGESLLTVAEDNQSNTVIKYLELKANPLHLANISN